MSRDKLLESELILNRDGSVYHLHLTETQLADTVILVGDQARVALVSRHFDKVEFCIHNREFITHTGIYKGKRMSAVSTGIGADNVDIVVNELDAAVNIDLSTRTLKKERKSLNLIRIGTSGSLQEDIPVGAFVISEYGLGLDGLLYYYKFELSEEERHLANLINSYLVWDPRLPLPYIVSSSTSLMQKLGSGMHKGITATATGFYGPQGRRLYLLPKIEDFGARLAGFDHDHHRITNFEMETSALFALGRMMDHQCSTCCAILANRVSGEHAENHKEIVDGLIETVLDRLVA